MLLYPTNHSFRVQEDGTKHWVFQGNPSIPDWQWKDGNKGVYFFDKDGMLTGRVNASVVSDFPIYKGPECLSRPDWDDLLICPYRYIKVRVGTDRLGRDRQTDRQSQRETERDRKRQRQTEHTERQKQRQTDRQTETQRETETETDRQTEASALQLTVIIST